jgi:hypothetical protein
MIDWNKIEKACMSLDKDCVPQNAREWKNFIDQYENCLVYHEGRGHDFTFDDMTENDHRNLVNKHMYLDKGYKKSVFECLSDLADDEKEILFDGVDWDAVMIIDHVWTRKDVILVSKNITVLPKCPEYVMGDFNCYNNQLTNLEGAPKYVGGNFCCETNKLTSLKGAPEHVGGNFDCQVNKLVSLEGAPVNVRKRFYCGGNKLPKSIPEIFPGKNLHKYVGLRHNPAGLKESFVMGWKEFNANK